MPQIKVLPTDLRNKIAAGEVVERPASVVKELIENAVDAGSSEIIIDVRSGGKHLIRVSDNGTGMDKENALKAFERHATSKLTQETDLFAITTLGFRGEALPAIASVSKIQVHTGSGSAAQGTLIEIRGAEIKNVKDAPPYPGTSIEVKDLFYNTPARKKFLKSTHTELYHIIDTVTRLAIPNPEIAFALTVDNQDTLNLASASGVRERLVQIFGSDFVAGLTEMQHEGSGIAFHAFVSDHQNFRKSKGHQFIFINRRPVRESSIAHAVYKAFEGILPQDRHPIYVILLTIDPHTVDVNVHPTKREVRFSEKETIYRIVTREVRNSVQRGRREFTREITGPAVSDYSEETDHLRRQTFDSGDAASVISENLELPYEHISPSLGLTIVDHHAAHERVLFEKLLKNSTSASMQLLFPKQIRFSAKEYSILLKNSDVLSDLGIEIDDFGQNTLVVRSVPEEFFNADLESILSDIATGLIDGSVSKTSLKKDIAALVACHRSIRGKEILGTEAISSLISDLEHTEHPDQCPHGRPTRIFFTFDDLNRLFKRK
jgi:DNA mismatch repair protein MutL